MYGYENPTVRTTEDGEIVGPRMHRVVEACDRRVWASRNQLAQSVGVNGSTNYGYRNVNRARRKGLIEIDPDHEKASPSGDGAVVITEKGQRYLDSQRE